jgi:uncharacterized protein
MKTITLEEHMSTERFLHATAPPQQPERPMAEFVARTNKQLVEVGSERISAMDRAGVDVQVLSMSAVGLNDLDPALGSALAEEANGKMADAVAAHPTRFAAFAALAPQRPEKAAEDLERWVGKHGFKGTMMHGTVGGEFLDRPRFMPIFEAAQALDVPVYIHPARPPAPVRKAYFEDLRSPIDFLMSTAAWGWHVETGLHALRLIVSGLFDRLPRLKIIIGHMGENLPYSIARADMTLTRATREFLKRPVADYFRQHFWVTTSGYFTVPPLMCAREVLGSERILFSVDYPYSEMPQGIGLLKALEGRMPQPEIEQIAFKNAQQLLRL